MARCDVCGNDYDRAFTLRTADGIEHTFDSFECAIHVCAPVCADCGNRVIGHGVQVDGDVFCCAHCARQTGATGVVDHVEAMS